MEQPSFVIQPEAQAILDHFCGAFGIRIAFFSTAGQEVLTGGQQPSCEYCRLLRAELKYDSQCEQLDREKRSEAARRQAIVSYQCHGGMTEAIVPVLLDQDLIGFMMIGQFRCLPEMPARIRRHWARQSRKDTLAQAFVAVPYVAPERLAHVLGLFQSLVRSIAARSLILMRHQHTVQQVIAYMREHLDQNTSAGTAARLAGCCESALCHKFNKVLGQSFKQTQIQLKMEKAEELFTRAPHLTVREIAQRLGYEDPLYFSRLYKKQRGEAPSRRRALARKE